MKIVGKIDLSKPLGLNSYLYAKYIPLYRDLGCACHYGGSCYDESYEWSETIVGYIKVDANDKFIADVDIEFKSCGVYYGTNELYTVNHDWLREMDLGYNREAFNKYPKSI